MQDITEEVKVLFKHHGMERWTDIQGIKNDNGEMYVIARNTYHCGYAHGDWAVWAYLPDSDLTKLNYPRYNVTEQEAHELAERGYL